LEEEKHSVNVDGVEICLSLFRLENAVIAFFYEGVAKLGTVAVSLTVPGGVGLGPSSTILGEKNKLAARVIAEKLASKTGRVALVSVYAKMPESELLKAMVRLIEKIC
jgi:hypothetical protein